jgi:quaternary ammonium compound-resistance protein SugE
MDLVLLVRAFQAVVDDRTTLACSLLRQDAVMAWLLLSIAGLLEVVWAFAMKLSEGFTRPGASAVTLLAMLASFALLSASMKTLPLGTAYTVWTGIGAVGAFVVGVIALGEPASAVRIVAAVLIVSGLILMKVSTP